MTDHLPECIYTPESFDPEQNIVWSGKPCICAALRACEARVRRDVDDVWVTQHDDHITWEWKGDTGYALVQREVLELLLARCNEPTYAAGVQAARDAVAGLNPLCSGLCECLPDALAAIDALNGEQA